MTILSCPVSSSSCSCTLHRSVKPNDQNEVTYATSKENQGTYKSFHRVTKKLLMSPFYQLNMIFFGPISVIVPEAPDFLLTNGHIQEAAPQIAS